MFKIYCKFLIELFFLVIYFCTAHNSAMEHIEVFAFFTVSTNSILNKCQSKVESKTTINAWILTS